MCIHVKELGDYDDLTRIKKGTVFSSLSPSSSFISFLCQILSISRYLKIDNPVEIGREKSSFYETKFSIRSLES